MSGPIALHGGGEFQAGDEPFLRRVLELAGVAARRTAGGTIQVVILPTAAARGRPALVGAQGSAAFERVAKGVASVSADPIAIEVEVVSVVDAGSAADPALAARLAAADLIHLPGGDPDLIPTILAGTPAWEAIVVAHRGGAVLAGASAGAMALAPWAWTPGGGIPGLGLVPGLIVVPHAGPANWTKSLERFRHWMPAGLGVLGLAERTGAISRPDEPGVWDVVGAGEVRWLAAGQEPGSTLVVAIGGSLRLPV